MVNAYQTVLALLALQLYVSAAPSSAPKSEDTTVENEDPKLDSLPSPLKESKDDRNATENQRQKRFYNHYGYEFPPFSPQYPFYNKRDQASDLGVYGVDDPLSEIHRRLQEIASIVRQPPPPPPPPVTPHIPLFFPVFFVPQGCQCTPTSDTTQPPPKPDTSQPTTSSPDGSTTSPDIFSRWPEMEDERQNWGFVINETENEGDDGEDYSRPISFDPIEPDTVMSRPAPPVEHGSNQAGAQTGGQSTTTARPSPPNIERQPNTDSSSFLAQSAPALVSAASGPYPQGSGGFSKDAPTTCDGAVLSCCHQLQVTYECFSILGCPDPTSYGIPCDPLVILKVIEKYQRFYGVKKG